MKTTAFAPAPNRIGKGDAMLIEQHTVIDGNGFHYSVFPGLRLVKCRECKESNGVLKVEAIRDLFAALHLVGERPREIPAIALTPMGDLFVWTPHLIMMFDLDLHAKSSLSFPEETVLNVMTRNGCDIFVITTQRLLKVVWTRGRLSFQKNEGGWESRWNTQNGEGIGISTPMLSRLGRGNLADLLNSKGSARGSR